jgi:hypothetical protein
MVTGIMAKYSQPELATRSLQGIRSLERKYTAERLEKACSMAVRHQGFNYFSVKSILEKKLDRLQVQKEKKSASVNQIQSPPANSSPSPSSAIHSNIRGKSYYAKPLFPLLQTPNPNDTGKGGMESC